ncbi:transposase, partial [Psychrosphaera sp. B3R10]|nr:transposase [Psychrosphaera sp. B3R10]
MAKRNPFSCRLIIYKQKSKGRKALNYSGMPRLSKHSKVNSKSARDPWLLTTSLPQAHQLAKRVTKIYRLRMQIEEGFRDM